MSYVDDQAAIAEFIRTKGITRCPTACLVPTQGSVTIADKLALLRHAQQHEQLRQRRLRNMTASLLPGGRDAGVLHVEH